MAWFLDNEIPRRMIKPGQDHDVAGAVEILQSGTVGLVDLNRGHPPDLAGGAHVFRTILAVRPRRDDMAYEHDMAVRRHIRRVGLQEFLALARLEHCFCPLNRSRRVDHGCAIFLSGSDIVLARVSNST